MTAFAARVTIRPIQRLLEKGPFPPRDSSLNLRKACPWLPMRTSTGPACRGRPARTGCRRRACRRGEVVTSRGEAWPGVDAIGRGIADVARFPQRLSQPEFYAAAYPLMLLSRRMEERLLELFQKGYVKGTVTISAGNEATAVGMTMPLRPGRDVVSLLHRDFVGHLLLGATPHQLFCQYMANAESPTHGREGNAHHGDAAARRLPMISHLGKMPSLVVGGTWAARQAGEDVFGLVVIGDGGSSTGEIHESLNVASVQKVPVLFLIAEQPLLVLHADQPSIQLPAAFRSGARLRHFRPDDRRHRCLAGLHVGVRRVGDRCRRRRCR